MNYTPITKLEVRIWKYIEKYKLGEPSPNTISTQRQRHSFPQEHRKELVEHRKTPFHIPSSKEDGRSA